MKSMVNCLSCIFPREERGGEDVAGRGFSLVPVSGSRCALKRRFFYTWLTRSLVLKNACLTHQREVQDAAIAHLYARNEEYRKTAERAVQRLNSSGDRVRPTLLQPAKSCLLC